MTEHFSMLLILLIVPFETEEYRFMRKIEGIGYPYYKILMALGNCKERIIFTEQKIWAKIFLNRVLDIYYRSDNEAYTVSRVEIVLVINNTSSFAYSEVGVGYPEFSGALYLPTSVGPILYSLFIYTCRRNDYESNNRYSNKTVLFYNLPFIMNIADINRS